MSPFSKCPAAPRDLHPFPPRRSSDLHGGDHAQGLRPGGVRLGAVLAGGALLVADAVRLHRAALPAHRPAPARSEEHTSELQSQSNLVCRLLLEKKKSPPCRREAMRAR